MSHARMHASELACLLPEVVRFIVHGDMQKAGSLRPRTHALGSPKLGAQTFAQRESACLAEEKGQTCWAMRVGPSDSLGCVGLTGPGLIWAYLELFRPATRISIGPLGLGLQNSQKMGP